MACIACVPQEKNAKAAKQAKNARVVQAGNAKAASRSAGETTARDGIKVIGVSDGDTISVLSNKKTIRVRLYGIDAPETRQAFGTQAKKQLSTFVFGKDVDLEVMDTDRYGRKVCKVYAAGTYVNLRMVQDGFAWHYRKYAPNESNLAKAQTVAQRDGKGLWTDRNCVAPWDFRHAPANPELGYWLNSSSGVRHNSKCRSFGTTKKGRKCDRDEGRPCGTCGG